MDNTTVGVGDDFLPISLDDKPAFVFHHFALFAGRPSLQLLGPKYHHSFRARYLGSYIFVDQPVHLPAFGCFPEWLFRRCHGLRVILWLGRSAPRPPGPASTVLRRGDVLFVRGFRCIELKLAVAG